MMNEPVDLTAITTPFGLLDEATQEALKAHGGPIERWGAYEGWVICPPLWQAPTVYRVRPAPVEPPKPREAWLRVNHNGELRTCDEEAEGATLWREVPA